MFTLWSFAPKIYFYLNRRAYSLSILISFSTDNSSDRLQIWGTSPFCNLSVSLNFKLSTIRRDVVDVNRIYLSWLKMPVDWNWNPLSITIIMLSYEYKLSCAV